MDRLGNNTSEDLVRRLDKEGLLKRNFINPPIKDTVTTPDGGYSILRFHAINPGTALPFSITIFQLYNFNISFKVIGCFTVTLIFTLKWAWCSFLK